MNLMVIDGYLGSGKTLGMSILARYFQERSGCSLYSNYGLIGAQQFNHYSQFLDLTNNQSSIVCLDEAHVDLDSRNSTTNISKYFTHLMFYFRKLRTTMFLATPSVENLDSRVRALANIYTHVEKKATKFNYHMWDLQSGRFLKTLSIPKSKAFAIAPQIYDTYKMVSPMIFPEKKEEFTKFISELKELNDTYYLAEGEERRTAPTFEATSA
ncbi:zonular occludens toxin domain-containing protein [Paenibacillus alvei]|uniref:zonular occludens toxin domain-containing protein n=1 Tax=Paenibacillus alvei TaxID=44250 RepID=UPI002282C0C7|nr:AAA family ATPase [Paenibacillus alvei]MCY7487900.1 hypothetical protein [Paenibacillus alvei]